MSEMVKLRSTRYVNAFYDVVEWQYYFVKTEDKATAEELVEHFAQLTLYDENALDGLSKVCLELLSKQLHANRTKGNVNTDQRKLEDKLEELVANAMC